MATSARSKRKSSPEIDRPFAASILRKASAAAQVYGIILWQEDGEYCGQSIELPNCMGTGKTPEQCLRDTRELMTTAIACDLERGIEPPPPAAANRRTEQVNIRLSPLERKRLEIAAQAGGYHGISDYMRDRALSA